MLAGRRAFDGDDVSTTLAAVLLKDPDWHALPASTPVGLRRLLTRCLTKDPKARLRDIGEARIRIDELLGVSQMTWVHPSSPGRSGWRRVVPWAAAGALALGAMLMAAVVALRPASERPRPLLCSSPSRRRRTHRLAVLLVEAPATPRMWRCLLMVSTSCSSLGLNPPIKSG